MAKNGKIEIEKGIPIPPPRRHRKSQYPWDSMEAGDSFFTTKPTGKNLAAQRLGRRFTVRREGDGRRVWRIE